MMAAPDFLMGGLARSRSLGLWRRKLHTGSVARHDQEEPWQPSLGSRRQDKVQHASSRRRAMGRAHSVPATASSEVIPTQRNTLYPLWRRGN